MELGGLSNLLTLRLNGNGLTGGIPTELGSLSNLVNLGLGKNLLTGEIVSEFGGLSNLERLDLSVNDLIGEVPAELGRLSNLQSLDLALNQLTGKMPAQLGDLSNLTALRLNDNQLTGEIPEDLGGLSNLQRLNLDFNSLTGGIPSEIGRLANLEYLFLNNNQLTGNIPEKLGSLANLLILRLNNNQLTGEIPAELGGLTGLAVLYLANNQFTGCIPVGLRDVPTNDLDDLGLPFCEVSSSGPEFAADTADRSVAENTAAGEDIGTPVAATDNNGDALTYALSGTDAASFDIDTGSGQLMTLAALDYETKASYSVTVTASDSGGLSDTIDVTITVTNVDEMGTITLSATQPAVGEALTATLTDPDSPSGVTGVVWQWASENTDGSTYTDIAGATSDSYTPAAADDGKHLRVTATYTDGYNAGNELTARSENPVTAGDPLLVRYDADKDGWIQLTEARVAVGDYFGPPKGEKLSLADTRKVVGLYFAYKNRQ